MIRMDDKIIVGSIINELTVLAYTDKPKEETKYGSWGGPWIKCKCSCGEKITVPLYGVKKGLIKSCGHLKGENGSKALKEYYKNHDPTNATYLTVEGVTKNISEWSRCTGIPRTTLLYRIEKNQTIEEIFRKDKDNNGQSNGETDGSESD